MLNHKVAIVTGASSGIGAAVARLLGAKGARVVLIARRKEKLEELAVAMRQAGCASVLPLPCDVTDRVQAENAVLRTIQEHGRIDILINNAGRGHLASVEDTTDEVIQSMFAVNVFSLWYMTRPALRQMKKQGSGHIINIASMAGKVGYPFNSAYVAAKHACVGFTHALRQELAETGIHATVVCPAGVLTDWASSTEGGSMLPLLKDSGPIVKRLAQERNLPLPQIEGVKTADQVAAGILEGIHHPVAEIYTHAGCREFCILSARDREAAERQQLAVVLGEKEAYEMHHAAAT